MKKYKLFLVLCVLFISLLIISSTFIKKNSSTEWEKNTLTLIDSAKYNDVNYIFSINPDIYDTYYILEMQSMVGINKKHNADNYNSFLKKEISNTNNIVDLIFIYKTSQILNLNIDIKDKIIKHNDFQSIEKGLLCQNDLEIINNLFLVDYLPDMIENSIAYNSKENLKLFAKRAIKDQNIIFSLNKLNNLIDLNKLINDNKDTVIKNSLNRINNILNSDSFINIEEVYDILKILINNKLIDTTELENQCNFIILDNRINLLSHKQLLYVLKIKQLLGQNITEYKNLVLDLSNTHSNYFAGYHTKIINNENIFDEDSIMNIIISNNISNDNLLTTDLEISNYITKEIKKENTNWKIIYLYLNYLSCYNKNKIYNLVINKDNVIFENNKDKWYYIRVLDMLTIQYDDQLLYSLISSLEKSIINNDIKNKAWDYYYYSEIVKFYQIIDIKNNVYDKINSQLRLCSSSNTGFFKLDNIENLYSTYICNVIIKNLNLVDMMIDNKTSFSKHLISYRTEFGGYSLIQEEEPFTFATFIGTELERIIDK
ncbi:hypothetical protein AN1V17_25120 [Vallitalea sediminicola]